MNCDGDWEFFCSRRLKLTRRKQEQSSVLTIVSRFLSASLPFGLLVTIRERLTAAPMPLIEWDNAFAQRKRDPNQRAVKIFALRVVVCLERQVIITTCNQGGSDYAAGLLIVRGTVFPPNPCRHIRYPPATQGCGSRHSVRPTIPISTCHRGGNTALFRCAGDARGHCWKGPLPDAR